MRAVVALALTVVLASCRSSEKSDDVERRWDVRIVGDVYLLDAAAPAEVRAGIYDERYAQKDLIAANPEHVRRTKDATIRLTAHRHKGDMSTDVVVSERGQFDGTLSWNGPGCEELSIHAEQEGYMPLDERFAIPWNSLGGYYLRLVVLLEKPGVPEKRADGARQR